MNRPSCTRRRILELGTLGLTTALAGCNTLFGPDIPDDYSDVNRTPPKSSRERAFDRLDIPEAALTFKIDVTTETLYSLTYTDGRPNPDDRTYVHPDNTNFNIVILDANTATATLERTQVTRDVELALHVRDINGDFKTMDTQTLSATGDSFETHEFTFDLSAIELPRNAGSICELTVTDPELEGDRQFSIKRHQFVGVSHKNGVNWVNSDTLNYIYKQEEDEPVTFPDRPGGVAGVTGHSSSLPAGYIETRDDDEQRTVFLVTRTSDTGELAGVSCHIDHEPVTTYQNGDERYQWQYGSAYETHYATEISHFQELAQKIHDLTTDMGLTQDHERLTVLGNLIQMIPYVRQHPIPLISLALYDHSGDCSSKSVLMACILQNNPWNIMPVYIDCEIDGIRHFAIGLPVDALGPAFDQNSAYLVSPSEARINGGITDTQYAFFEMTSNAPIGVRGDSVENVSIYDQGDFSTRASRHVTNDPPSY